MSCVCILCSGWAPILMTARSNDNRPSISISTSVRAVNTAALRLCRSALVISACTCVAMQGPNSRPGISPAHMACHPTIASAPPPPPPRAPPPPPPGPLRPHPPWPHLACHLTVTTVEHTTFCCWVGNQHRLQGKLASLQYAITSCLLSPTPCHAQGETL